MGKEASYIRAVNKHLPKEVYTEGMANPYRGGTPDRYYEGPHDDLWVEYKFYEALPPVIDLLHQTAKTKPKLSKLQQDWLVRAHCNNRKVAVIVGCPEGGLILPGISWGKPIKRETFRLGMQTKPAIAEWITRAVMRDGGSK
jgi:hypothetical protein